MRRGRDSNPRYPGGGTHAFQASPFDRSGTSPKGRQIYAYYEAFTIYKPKRKSSVLWVLTGRPSLNAGLNSHKKAASIIASKIPY